jgi:hypothetical protein
LSRHADDEDVRVLHELRIPRPSARVDIAVVNGEIGGFEIKSDVDSLSRLPNQAIAFNAIFDRMSVVTTVRHLNQIRKIIPTWWGIIAVENKNDTIEFDQRRQATANTTQDPEALLHILTRSELVGIRKKFHPKICASNLSRVSLVIDLIDNVSPLTLWSEARKALKLRAANYSPPS